MNLRAALYTAQEETAAARRDCERLNELAAIAATQVLSVSISDESEQGLIVRSRLPI